MKKFKIFTPCWSEKHIDLFANALSRSLAWPKNRAEMEDAAWAFVVSNNVEGERLTSLVEAKFKITPDIFLIRELAKPGIDTGQVLVLPLLGMIQRCLKDDEPMLIATPDFIWGDGTIRAFRHIASDKGEVASIAHIRVLPAILETLPLAGCTNRELASRGLDNAHLSWTGSSSDSKPARSFHSGVYWKEIENSFAVKHYMPSPFFCNFLEEDQRHLQEVHEGKPPGFGLIDHVWPTQLIKAGRLRFIGDSDTAMMLEVTDADKNVPPINEGDQRGFFRHHLHNLVQSQFVTMYKGLDSEAT